METSCPVNFQMLDENQVRIQALLITLTAIGFISTGSIVFVLILLYDFGVRLFISAKMSLYVHVAKLILSLFKIEKSLVDSAPKIFASKIGLLFSSLIIFSLLMDLSNIAIIFAIILAICAGAEALFNYCVGCKFYTILQYFKII